MRYEKGQMIDSYYDKYDRKRYPLEEDSYALTENQAQFCNDAYDAGYSIDFTYSGRGMYGRICPAIKVESAHDFATKAKVREDGLGRGIVIYAQY